MNPFTAIGDAVLKIIQGFTDCISAIIESMTGLVNGLDYVDSSIVNMKNLDISAVEGGSSLPVVQAVATIKYLMPTDIFYFIYLLILIGICFAVYKIVAYILTVLLKNLFSNFDGFSGSSILSKISGMFRK